jgi:hypothetical protein
MCAGTLRFDVIAAGAARSLTLHHGESLRWPESDGNLMLLAPDAIMDWLSARGVTFVREQYEASRRLREVADTEASRWSAMMPASLRPFFEEMQRTGGSEDPAWTAAIEQQFPDPVHRATILLAWFGSSGGPWSGYPSWESVPQQLLLALPLGVLLSAIGDAPDDRTCEGAARLFCSWDFGKRRRKERARLPAELRRQLLDHVERSGDDSKRAQARRLLGMS